MPETDSKPAPTPSSKNTPAPVQEVQTAPQVEVVPEVKEVPAVKVSTYVHDTAAAALPVPGVPSPGAVSDPKPGQS